LQGFRSSAADGRDQEYAGICADMRRFGNFGAEVPETAKAGLICLKGVDHRPLRGGLGARSPRGRGAEEPCPTAAVLTGQNQEGDPSEANGIVALTGEAAAAGSRRGVRCGAESEWARVADRIQVRTTSPARELATAPGRPSEGVRQAAQRRAYAYVRHVLIVQSGDMHCRG
jgi:hypothetical protein